MSVRRLRIFYIYSHHDRRLRDALGSHLAALDGKYISQWSDREIGPGGDWDGIIHRELEAADLFLLLISHHLLASRYVNDVELNRALARAHAGDARVVPVILSPSLWEQKFGGLQAVPSRPVTAFRNRNSAFLEIAESILNLASRYDEELALQKSLLTQQPTRKLESSIPSALPFLCDRTRHLRSLDAPFQSHRARARRGPFCLVVPGPRLEAHRQFIARLDDVIASKLAMPGKPVHRFGHVTLPDVTGRASKVADAVAAPLSRTMGTEELMDGVSLVTASFVAPGWSRRHKAIAEAWLRFWDQWPDLPHSAALVACLLVEYAAEDATAARRLQKTFSFDRWPRRSGFILPELHPIERAHVVEWVMHERVRRFYKPERVEEMIQAVDQLYAEAHSIPMEVLAPQLSTLISQWATV